MADKIKGTLAVNFLLPHVPSILEFTVDGTDFGTDLVAVPLGCVSEEVLNRVAARWLAALYAGANRPSPWAHPKPPQ